MRNSSFEIKCADRKNWSPTMLAEGMSSTVQFQRLTSRCNGRHKWAEIMEESCVRRGGNSSSWFRSEHRHWRVAEEEIRWKGVGWTTNYRDSNYGFEGGGFWAATTTFMMVWRGSEGVSVVDTGRWRWSRVAMEVAHWLSYGRGERGRSLGQ